MSDIFLLVAKAIGGILLSLRRTLRRDINAGKLDITDIEDICRWLREPRHRVTKGKPILWLRKNKERGGRL